MDVRQGDAVVWRNRAVTLFDRIPMPAAVCDVYGSVVLVNPAMATEWGTPPGRLRGRDVLELFRPQEATQVERIAQALRLRHRSRYPVSVRWDAADGAHRHGELTADPMSDGPDVTPYLLVLVTRPGRPHPSRRTASHSPGQPHRGPHPGPPRRRSHHRTHRPRDRSHRGRRQLPPPPPLRPLDRHRPHRTGGPRLRVGGAQAGGVATGGRTGGVDRPPSGGTPGREGRARRGGWGDEFPIGGVRRMRRGGTAPARASPCRPTASPSGAFRAARSSTPRTRSTR